MATALTVGNADTRSLKAVSHHQMRKQSTDL